MARTIFLLLILLNLLALAWIYLKGDARMNAGREPQRIKMALAAEKIHILAPTEDPKPGISTVSHVAEGCRAFAGATPTEAREIIEVWTAKLPAARVVVNPVLPPKIFEIAITGLVSRVAAETKQAELKRLGFNDGVQITAGEDKRFSVLMASFSERAAADEALKAAGKKGVRSATIVERQPVPVQSIIEVYGGDAVMKQLPELARQRRGLSPLACDAASVP